MQQAALNAEQCLARLLDSTPGQSKRCADSSRGAGRCRTRRQRRHAGRGTKVVGARAGSNPPIKLSWSYPGQLMVSERMPEACFSTQRLGRGSGRAGR